MGEMARLDVQITCLNGGENRKETKSEDGNAMLTSRLRQKTEKRSKSVRDRTKTVN